MPDIETSIRITAETKAALQNLAALDTKMGESARAVLAASNNASAGFSRMDGAMGMLAKRSTPALGAAFGSLSSQAISMTTGFSGASGMIGMLGQSMLMVSPVIGGVAIAAAALTTILLKKKDSVDSVTAAWKPNLDMLRQLVEANDALSLSAGRALEAALKDKKARLELLEVQLLALEATPLRMSALALEAREIGMLYDAEKAQKIITQDSLDATKERRIEVNKLREAILLLRKEIEAGTATPFGPPTPTSGPAAAGPTTANWEFLNRRAEIETGYEQLLRGTNSAILDQGVAYTAMSDVAIGSIGKVQKVEAAHQKAILTANQMRVVAIAQGAAQMLLLEKKNVGEVLQAVIAGIEAELLAKAILWTAEGIALMFTPGKQAQAGAKFTAAAMAGAGAGALAVIGSAFEEKQSAMESTSGAAIAGSAGGEGSSTGRTLVSQGPVTLYYNATLVVNGSILDRGDFFALWNEANLQNLRTANVDVSQRARK
jgi:hypothetical protein